MLSYRVEKINKISYQEYLRFREFLPELSRRIDDYVFYEDKLRCSYAYYIAKEMAAKELGCSLDELVVKFAKNQKPYFERNPVYFNISHSHNYVACAVDVNPIGIDIEKITPFVMDELDYAFSKDEINYILASESDSEKAIRSCEVWTFKEAYQKLLGVEWYDFKSISMFNMSEIFQRFYIDNHILTICSFNF